VKNNRYKFLCYASGSTEIGFGHLYRLTRIIDLCNIKNQTLFLYQNNLEKSFLESRKFHLYNNELISPKLILIDSKIDCSSLYNSFYSKNNKLIIIDNIDTWVKNVDSVVLPSFYINQKKVNDFLKGKTIDLFFGKEYSILSSPIIKKKTNNNKILITFGGSDPNNITSTVVKMLWKSNFKNRLKIILGPGYLHSKEEIIKKYQELDIVSDCNDMASEIGNSSIIITALGTTLQDIEFYGKKSIIICNYEDDLDDYYYVSSMSRLKSRMQCIGLWESFSEKTLINTIQRMDSLEEDDIDGERLWGSSWKKLIGRID